MPLQFRIPQYKLLINNILQQRGYNVDHQIVHRKEE